MPIVRELINLVSFSVDKSSVKGAEQTFTSIAKKAALAVTALTVGAVKVGISYENAIANARFYGIEMADISRMIAENAGEGFSKLEIARTISQLAELAISGDQLKESLGYLKNISIARGFTEDLGKVQEYFSLAVKSGDIEALKQLGGVSKFLAEKLRVVDFREAFKNMPEASKVRFVLQVMRDQAEEMAKLAEERKKGDLGYQLDKTISRGSDAFLKFFDTTKPLLMEMIKLVNDIGDAFARWGDNAFFKTFTDIIKIATAATKGFREFIKGGDLKEIGGKFLDSVGIPVRENKDTKSGKSSKGGFSIGGAIEDLLSSNETFMGFHNFMFPQEQQSTKQVPQLAAPQAPSEQKITVDISGDVSLGGQPLSTQARKELEDKIVGNITNAFSRIARSTGQQIPYAPVG